MHVAYLIPRFLAADSPASFVRKDQIDEVYFMLNCFSNNVVEQKLKSDVEKVSKRIIQLGFNKDNIYVCDLRKSTEESQEMSEMWGFPSYASFKNAT